MNTSAPPASLDFRSEVFVAMSGRSVESCALGAKLASQGVRVEWVEDPPDELLSNSRECPAIVVCDLAIADSLPAYLKLVNALSVRDAKLMVVTLGSPQESLSIALARCIHDAALRFPRPLDIEHVGQSLIGHLASRSSVRPPGSKLSGPPHSRSRSEISPMPSGPSTESLEPASHRPASPRQSYVPVGVVEGKVSDSEPPLPLQSTDSSAQEPTAISPELEFLLADAQLKLEALVSEDTQGSEPEPVFSSAPSQLGDEVWKSLAEPLDDDSPAGQWRGEELPDGAGEAQDTGNHRAASTVPPPGAWARVSAPADDDTGSQVAAGGTVAVSLRPDSSPDPDRQGNGAAGNTQADPVPSVHTTVPPVRPTAASLVPTLSPPTLSPSIVPGTVAIQGSLPPTAPPTQPIPRPSLPSVPLPPPTVVPSKVTPAPLEAPVAKSTSGQEERDAEAANEKELPPPRALRRGVPAEVLGESVRTRFTGCLAFEVDHGLRRVVFRDGDLVLASSAVHGESLVAYLVQRGDIAPEVADQIEHRVPMQGRHAGAALIARGLIEQGDLWPVLRSHAEWILVEVLQVEKGTVQEEAPVPERLAAEPSVFGGATGAEVLVDIVQRSVPSEEAHQILSASAATLEPGKSRGLLAECALSARLQQLVQRSETEPLSEVLLHATDEPMLLSVLYALTLLQVLQVAEEVAAPIAKSPPPLPKASVASPDSIDDDALRSRVLSRRAVVEDGDYFAVLGVGRRATGYDIRRSYLNLRRQFSPASVLRPATLDLQEDVDTILEVLDEAYNILRDQQRRERYRRAIEARPN